MNQYRDIRYDTIYRAIAIAYRERKNCSGQHSTKSLVFHVDASETLKAAAE